MSSKRNIQLRSLVMILLGILTWGTMIGQDSKTYLHNAYSAKLDLESDSIIKIARSKFHYNDQDKVVKTYSQFWDLETETWKDISRYDSLIYNSNGLITEKHSYRVGDSLDNQPHSKEFYKYDNQGNNHLRLHYSYNQMEQDSQTVDSLILIYNDLNQKIESEFFVFWNLQDGSKWQLEEFSYDSIGHLISTERYRYNTNLSDYEFLNSEHHHYDSNNLLIKSEYITYDEISNTSLPFFKYEYEHDEFNNFLNRKHYSYLQGNWDLKSTRSYNYDNSINGDKLIIPKLFQFDQSLEPFEKFSHKLDSYYTFQESDTIPEINNSNYIFFNYSKSILSTSKEELSLGLSIYPNPCLGKIQIDFGENDIFNFKIFNSKGLLLLNGRSYNDESIDVSTLQTGVYFCIIEKGDKKYLEQFVKQ